MAAMAALFLSRGGLLSRERAFLERRGVRCVERAWDQVSLPLDVDDPPATCRWLLSPRLSLDAFAFQLACIEALELAGTRVFNPPRAVLSCDKASMIGSWQGDLRHVAREVSFPETIVTPDSRRARLFIERHGRVVCKPLSGQGGQGIRFLDPSTAHLDGILAGAIAERGVVLLQAAIPDPKHETRSFVVGSNVVASHARLATSGFGNLTRGGIALPLDHPRVALPASTRAAIEHLSTSIATTLNLDAVAVDCIIGKNGDAWLLEWNPFPGMGGCGDGKAAVETAIVDHLHELATRGR